MLKYNPGALLLAGAVSGGYGWYDTERSINFPGFLALAEADHEVSYLNGRFRAAYLFSAGSWYAKPMVDFDATHISLNSVREKGAGGVGLNVRGQDQTVLSASPALELGAQFGAPQGTLVRPYVRGGATFYDDPDFVLLASFEGAPWESTVPHRHRHRRRAGQYRRRRRRDRSRRSLIPALLRRPLRRHGRAARRRHQSQFAVLT